MSSTPRPDEIASESRIKRANERDETLKSGLKMIPKAAIAATGVGLSSRILPFLNEYITPEIALKGISKVSPKMGDFLKQGLSKGLNLKDGLNYIKENMGGGSQKTEEKPEKEKDPLDLIKGYQPELADFIMQHIQNGRQPEEAAAMAKLPGKFDKVVRKIETDSGENFVDLVNRLLGIPKKQAQGQQQAQGQPQPQQGQQQPGQGQQALMQAIQKLQQMRGGQ